MSRIYAKGHGRDRAVTTADLPAPTTSTSPNGADGAAPETAPTTLVP